MLNVGSDVSGVTEANQQGYVAVATNNKNNLTAIKLFQSTTFHKQKDLSVDCSTDNHNRISAKDIASCWTNGTIYILDELTSSVTKIIDVDTPVPKWLSLTNHYPILSVTWDCKVLFINKLLYSIDLYYVEDGRQSSSPLPLKTTLTTLLHAVQLRSGNFLISGIFAISGITDNSMHRVCILSFEGYIGNCFGSYPGNGADQLHNPVHMAVDEQDRVFVADYANKRVLLLDPELKTHKVLLSHEEDNILGPTRLHYSPNTKRLFVGYGESGLLGVYTIKLP